MFKPPKGILLFQRTKHVEIPCRVNLSLNKKLAPVMFEPHVNPDVPDGLCVTVTVLNLKGGSYQLFNIQIVNSANNGIFYLEELSWTTCNWFAPSHQLMSKLETLTVWSQMSTNQLIISVQHQLMSKLDTDSLESNVYKPADNKRATQKQNSTRSHSI